MNINLTNFANSWRHFKVISSALNLQGKVAKFLAMAQLVQAGTVIRYWKGSAYKVRKGSAYKVQ